MERQVSVRDGLFRTKLLEGGQGEPLLFLHGAGGNRGWAPFLEMLAQQFHVYAPWHPGFGESEGIEHVDDILDMVLYYHDLLDLLGIESAHLLGHSMGGMFAAEIAAICPHRVRKLVLAAPVGLWLDERPVADFFVMPPQELFPAIWYDPNSLVAQQFLPDTSNPEALAQAMLDRMQSLAAAGKFLWPIPDRGLHKRMHRIQAPTLILWGEGDGIVSPVYGEEFRRRIKESQLVVMSACSHMLMYEKPEEFVQTVVGFLKS